DAVRICLPRRFGKSFNLSVIEHFFNLVTVNDCLGHPGEPGLDAARDRRRQLFRGSLFEQFHPDFVEKHFASVPVIKINFACSGGHTLGFFHASLASAIYDAATFWIDAYAAPELLKGRARAKYEALQHTYSSMSISLGEDESKWEARGGLASVLFKGLSGFLVAQHGHKYIILVDEYDQPLEAALGKKWQAKADWAYLGLLMQMFEGNDHLAKGLLVGVHEFGLSNRESGLNCAEEVSLTTGRYRGGDAESADTRDESPGPLAALFAFTKEDVAELTAKMLGVYEGARSHSQEAVTGAIDTWYGGYDFGFPGKRYNPWSVLKFLEILARGATIEDAAAPYGVNTGGMASIAQLARRHREEILQLAPRLLSDYQAGADNSSIRVAGQSGKAECVLPPGDFARVSIGRTTYPSSSTDLRSTDEVVTHLLHLGYLTMSPGNRVRIPNGEMRVMWRNAATDPLLIIEATEAKGIIADELIEQLYMADVSGLQMCMSEAMTYVSNERAPKESTYASVLRMRLGEVFCRHRAVTIINESQSGVGKSDIIIQINFGFQVRDRLIVIVELKRILGPRANDMGPDAAEGNGLQPKDKRLESKNKRLKRRVKVLALMAKRLDIGMVVGKVVNVVASTRWWAWSPDNTNNPTVDLEKRKDEVVNGVQIKGETTHEWLERIHEADKTMWRDGLGWRAAASKAAKIAEPESAKKLSPFNSYLKTELPKVKQANPELLHKEAIREVAEKWKTAEANPKAAKKLSPFNSYLKTELPKVAEEWKIAEANPKAIKPVTAKVMATTVDSQQFAKESEVVYQTGQLPGNRGIRTEVFKHADSDLRVVVCHSTQPLFAVNIYVPTISPNNKGLPHTLEHLV
ncbi:hypothetical protein H4R21_003266, partial [Coemansia helicoidea]